MAQKQVKGIGGVLGNIISRNEAAANAPEEETVAESRAVEMPKPVETPGPPEAQRQVEGAQFAPAQVVDLAEPPAATPKRAAPLKKQEARRGRPPGSKTPAAMVEREKVSLRLRSDLAATYRDWSWKEQCQFSDLVDRALEYYWKAKGNARKPEKE
ncbi:hypothetical protein TA3x_005801 (plasmid) [Tundrisphaera sp. TA3]|uniref:hypothetical protein n=1 Tax=Tundrisphaera sp. TA3 TaxID=3435775 RepID=UPI003EB8E792